jgi:hypothetical protein
MSAQIHLNSNRTDCVHDFVFPTLLFAALGAMTWAVRGTAGASAMNAHIASGLTWGAAWWYLAHDPAGRQSRRYASGWIVFALTVGFALAGNRGWVQWANFFEGHLITNRAHNQWVPISRSFGFLWMFLAGAGWAGLPACFLAWCGERRPLRAWEWTVRLACGMGAGYLAWRLYIRVPEVFLPQFTAIKARYLDFQSNPDLGRLYRDNGATLRHIGYCVGFLLFEAVRKDWKNVVLISSVSLLNGVGWAICQNWKWAVHLWHNANFNFWRCWECCGGISIGVAFGVAYFLVNRTETAAQQSQRNEATAALSPRGTWLLGAGLLLLLGWTDFWPAVTDLRQRFAPSAPGGSANWGSIRIGAAVTCLVAALAHRLLAGRVTEDGERIRAKLASLERWTELLLMIVLGWFLSTEVNAGFGDGVRPQFSPKSLAPGDIYFFLVFAYCCYRIVGGWLGRGESQSSRGTADLDWLTTYLALTTILLAGIGVHLTTRWHAPIWYGVVAAAYAIGYYLLTRRTQNDSDAGATAEPTVGDPNLERWALFLGLLYGLGLSLRKTLKGGAFVYFGNENAWDRRLWNWVAVGMLVCMTAGAICLLIRRLPRNFGGDRFPCAAAIVWLVLIAENVVAQVVTGPVFGPGRAWNDFMFNLLYLILFAISGVIVYHYQLLKSGRMRVHIDTSGAQD